MANHTPTLITSLVFAVGIRSQVPGIRCWGRWYSCDAPGTLLLRMMAYNTMVRMTVSYIFEYAKRGILLGIGNRCARIMCCLLFQRELGVMVRSFFGGVRT